MSVSLSKGNKVNLSKLASDIGVGLDNVAVGLGWDCRETAGADFDLDAWALLVSRKDGLKKRNLVYFSNKMDESRCVHHMGDNLTGAGDGDDETIEMKLSSLPEDIIHILVGVTIFRAGQRRQSFGDVTNTFIRLYDKRSGVELCRYDDKFTSEFSKCTTVLFTILSRNGSSWDFNVIGSGNKMSSVADALNTFADYEYLLANVNKDNTNNSGGKKKMAVSLSKGGKVSLAKVASDAGIAALDKITVGLGWDVNRYDGGADFDLDAAAFMLGNTGKVRSDADFIFYNNKKGPGVEHTGDNRTGAGEGDDEQIKVVLSQIPADVDKVSFTVTIDQADTRNQNFGMVENSFIRIVDDATGTELIRYDLGEDFSVETAIVVAELYRNNGEWKFNAIGAGFAGGLKALCGNFGIDAE